MRTTLHASILCTNVINTCISAQFPNLCQKREGINIAQYSEYSEANESGAVTRNGKELWCILGEILVGKDQDAFPYSVLNYR